MVIHTYVRNDKTKTSSIKPQLQIRIKVKEAILQIVKSYLHTNLCLQQFILLLILFSSVFIALDCSTAFCLISLRAFMKSARSSLLLFDWGIASMHYLQNTECALSPISFIRREIQQNKNHTIFTWSSKHLCVLFISAFTPSL